ncbi:hypothetical protein MaudCBS49596_008059 [Microsporum audouinii]
MALLEDTPDWELEQYLNIEIEEFNDYEYQSTEEIQDNIEEVPPSDEEIEIVLPGRSSKPVTVKHIEYAIALPEYPKTSTDGYGYCLRADHLDADAVKRLHSQIQYGHGNSAYHTTRKTKSPFLGNVDCLVNRWRCSGARICSKAKPELLNMEHTEVTNYTQLEMGALRATQQADNYDQNWAGIENAEQTWNTYNQLTYSHEQKCDCGKLKAEGIPPQYFVTCESWSHGRKFTFYRAVQPDINVTFLKDLISSNGTAVAPTCTYVQPVVARQEQCDVHHQRTIITKRCSVEFVVVAPHNLKKTPYVLFASFGVHVHPPPPPTKTPSDITQELLDVIQTLDSHSVTTNRFLRSAALQKYLKDKKVNNLTDIHPSLNNISRFQAALKKQRLLTNPVGEAYEAVLFHKKITGSEYIRYLYNDGINLMIILLLEDQAKLFNQISSFQVDMTFKKIAGEINLIDFIYVDPLINRVITIGRVLVNKNSSLMYKKVFECFFRTIEEITNTPVQWGHIHGKGIQAVVTDMCSKQASGLGSYLEELDATKKWREHIQHILVFCTVHYRRGIQHFNGHSAYQLMKALPFTHDSDYVESILSQLSTDTDLHVAAWAQHKRIPWILSGLNRCFTKMDPKIFTSLQRNSNAIESNHHRINSLGIRTSLLQGIIDSEVLDRRDTSKLITFRETGVKPQWDNNGKAKQLERAAKKVNQKKRCTTPITPSRTTTRLEAEMSSSGALPKRKRKGSSRELLPDLIDLTQSPTPISRPRKKRVLLEDTNSPPKAGDCSQHQTSPDYNTTDIDIQVLEAEIELERQALKVKEMEAEIARDTLNLQKRKLDILKLQAQKKKKDN